MPVIPKVYFSYAWGDDETPEGKLRAEAANTLFAYLREKETRGEIKVFIDRERMSYKSSIRKFTEAYGDSEAIIILIISEKYLQSEYCMGEVVQILSNKDYRERIFPMVLPDANLRDPLRLAKYHAFWDKRKRELSIAIKEIEDLSYTGPLHEILRDVAEIVRIVSHFTTEINDLITVSPPNYTPLLEGLEQRLNRLKVRFGQPLKDSTSNLPDHNFERAGRINLTLQEVNKQSQGKNYFLGIAIDEYEHWPRLKNAKRDVQAVANILKEKFGYQDDCMILLTDREANRENIIANLDAYETYITPNDTLVIYFAGHGHLKKGKKEIGYWIPVEGKQETTASYIPNSTALEHISNIDSLHTFVIVDACFSGIILKRGKIKEQVRNPEELSQRSSRWALCSGRHDEAVDDGPDGEHSPFASSILRILRSHEDVYLLVGDLVRHVKKEKINGQQPDGGPLRQSEGEDGGEFAFQNTSKVRLLAHQANWAKIVDMPEELLSQVKEKRSKLREFHDYYSESVNQHDVVQLERRLKHREEYLALPDNESSILDFLNAHPDSPNKVEIEKKLEKIQAKQSEMVFVEGGSFYMGGDLYENEKPIHRVTLKSYYIGKYPVTQKEWRNVMDSDPSSFPNCDDCPVVDVSWRRVKEFLRRLNARTGQDYRLPTEAEWEFAARGGNQSKGYKFAGSDIIDEVAWYEINSGGKIHKVGQKLPNELGIHDMSGNVWEWCQDRYGKYDSNNMDVQVNPTGFPHVFSKRVCRGGAWAADPNGCTVSSRDKNRDDMTCYDLGFRLARDI